MSNFGFSSRRHSAGLNAFQISPGNASLEMYVDDVTPRGYMNRALIAEVERVRVFSVLCGRGGEWDNEWSGEYGGNDDDRASANEMVEWTVRRERPLQERV